MESEGGSWDFDMEVGIDNAAIPASILRGSSVTRKIMEWKGCILMRPWSKSSADIFCWYVGKLWSYSHDSFAGHLSKGWSSKSTR